MKAALKRLVRPLRTLKHHLVGKQTVPPNPPGVGPAPAIEDRFCHDFPSPQSAVNLFAGEWTSSFPAGSAAQTTGHRPDLFDDDRVKWSIQQFGGVKGKSVLELGPLEGGHAYMFEQAGASEVVSIEGNMKAYMRCLVVKEVMKLTRTQFLLGDFNEYLRKPPRRFDAGFACGVLYHMRNPIETLELLTRVTDQIGVWTHYYDPAVIERRGLTNKFSTHAPTEWNGFSHTLHRYEYLEHVNWTGFCGGSALYSCWLTKDDILNCLRHFGFNEIRVMKDDPECPFGPAFTFYARRT